MTKGKKHDKASSPASVREGQVCPGCGGDCRNCDGVVRGKKGAGRPKKFCCLNCKQRAGSRAYYRREFQKMPDDERAARGGDLKRAIDGHKKKGHDGKPCPSPMMGDRNSCRVLAELYDDQREGMGLNRMMVDIVDGI